ncbi:MAG: CBS domain-containing protein [Bdellovibrionales bacterium]|nr:CBS domain-containing protein [Bdellovibrionales bacterium]
MVPIKEILPEGLLAVKPEATVKEAVAYMTERRCGAVVVIQDDKLAGIFSERDLMNRVVAKGLDPAELVIGDVMTKDVITITPETDIEEAMRLMYKKRLRHLPVVGADERPFGMLGLRDVTDFIVRGLYGER